MGIGKIIVDCDEKTTLLLYTNKPPHVYSPLLPGGKESTHVEINVRRTLKVRRTAEVGAQQAVFSGTHNA